MTFKKQKDITTHVDETTAHKNNPNTWLTKLRRKEAEDAAEVINKEEILAAGQEDAKKGMAEAKRQADEEKAAKNKIAEQVVNELDMKKRFDQGYKEALARGLADLLASLDWIKGWTADVIATNGSPISIKGKPFTTKNGILMIVCTPDGRVFHKGMLMTKEAPLDYAGIYTMAIQMENTMDKERGLLLDGSQNKPEPSLFDQYGQPINQQGAVDSTDGTTV